MAGSRRLRVAVIGADGLVGEAIVRLLDERAFPIERLHPLAGTAGVGSAVEFGGRRHPVRDAEGFDFDGLELAFVCGAGTESAARAARSAGARVIEYDGPAALDPDVPLVVPELDAAVLGSRSGTPLVASPSAATVAAALVLHPLQRAAGIERASITVFQPVAAAGRGAVDELARQCAELLGGRGPVDAAVLPQRIAFNVVPQVGAFCDGDGVRTDAEARLERGLPRVLGDDAMQVDATCAHVPVFFGESLAVSLRTHRTLSAQEARRLLAGAVSVRLVEASGEARYPTVAADALESDDVLVGRIRAGTAQDARTLQLWIVHDDVRRGAAGNCVRIAETLVRDNL